MTHKTSLRSAVGYSLLVSLLGTAWLPAGTAWGQESEKPKPVAESSATAADKETQDTRVYTLQQADGKLMLRILAEAIPTARMSFYDDNNRLIVIASRSEHKRLADLLKVIDTPPETEANQMKVFQLVHSDVQSMGRVIQMIIPEKDKSKVYFAADQRTNSLLVSGPEDSLKVIEAVLERLDVKAPSLSEQPFRVRIVWFTEAAAGDDAVKLDDDLRIVAEALSRAGADSMIPAGQTIVQVASKGKFRISCSTTFGAGPAMLDIQGQLDIEQQATRLEIQIAAMRQQQGGSAEGGGTQQGQLVNLATEIVAPLDHFVVLGVTPVEEKTIAFAVHVLPVE
jgi:Bacterial type II/III secretion system short domain